MTIRNSVSYERHMKDRVYLFRLCQKGKRKLRHVSNAFDHEFKLVELRKLYALSRSSCAFLHTIGDKDNSFSENKHNNGMLG